MKLTDKCVLAFLGGMGAGLAANINAANTVGACLALSPGPARFAAGFVLAFSTLAAGIGATVVAGCFNEPPPPDRRGGGHDEPIDRALKVTVVVLSVPLIAGGLVLARSNSALGFAVSEGAAFFMLLTAFASITRSVVRMQERLRGGVRGLA
jgi:hypothetical protein